ncbi:MAG: hypothetical protein GWN00_40030, partial [Aliifodinibius sp.]|nr:hypothetical protein [Fodinibius sp.]NIV16745.1 hypothetical protein [Fodinibius sp.]NIY30746.1 hypothetical protein [Fodinibius sp.]
MGKNISFDDFIAHPTASNFQVKKIAGKLDLDFAKEIITKRFILAGPTDKFDEFLLLLGQHLSIPQRILGYEKRNISTTSNVVPLNERQIEILMNNNRVDISLYRWISDEYFPEQIEKYGPTFTDDLAKL